MGALGSQATRIPRQTVHFGVDGKVHFVTVVKKSTRVDNTRSAQAATGANETPEAQAAAGTEATGAAQEAAGPSEEMLVQTPKGPVPAKQRIADLEREIQQKQAEADMLSRGRQQQQGGQQQQRQEPDAEAEAMQVDPTLPQQKLLSRLVRTDSATTTGSLDASCLSQEQLKEVKEASATLLKDGWDPETDKLLEEVEEEVKEAP